MSQGAMFPQRIERITTAMLEGAPVGVSCRTEALMALSADGRRWVLKKKITASGLLAEAVAWLACRHLGVDIPHAVAVRTDSPSGPPWLWASEFVPLYHWREEHAESVGDPSKFAALVALDAWLGNGDRHSENLVLRQTEDADRVEILALDFDAAWVGDGADREARATEHPRPLPVAPPAELWTQAVPGWVARVQGIEHNLLREFVAEACELSASPAAPQIIEWLVFRQNLLPGLAAAMTAELVEVPS